MTVQALEKKCDELLQLTIEERTFVVERLVASLDPALNAEIARRVLDHESGGTPPLDADEVHARLWRNVHEANQVPSRG